MIKALIDHQVLIVGYVIHFYVLEYNKDDTRQREAHTEGALCQSVIIPTNIHRASSSSLSYTGYGCQRVGYATKRQDDMDLSITGKRLIMQNVSSPSSDKEEGEN